MSDFENDKHNAIDAGARPADSEYTRDYSETGFWSKLAGFAKVAGKEVVEKALLLFYIAKSDNTPWWAKSIVFAALGYFINSIDAIPDVTPLVGFADDLGVLAAAVASLSTFINPDLQQLADDKMQQWFGTDESSPPDGTSENTNS